MEGPPCKATWFAKFQHITAGIRGDSYDEVLVKDQWTRARAYLPPCKAYAHLLDELYAEQSGEVHRPPGTVLEDDAVEVDRTRESIFDANDRESVQEQEQEQQQKQQAGHPDVSCAGDGATLWFGDIPSEMATVKRLREVLYIHKPSGTPTPFLKKVVSRGYRRQGGPMDGDADQLLHTEKAWLGYAFVAFRDAAEARDALVHFDGRSVAGWTMRVQWAEARHQAKPKLGGNSRQVEGRLAPGWDPLVDQQLFPLSLTTTEFLAMVERRKANAGLMKIRHDASAWVTAEVIKAHYRRHPRRQLYRSGVPIPAEFLQPLLTELRHTRWPPIAHRPGMHAQHYLILYWGSNNEGYEALYLLLRQLLKWIEPEYPCTMVAVTKDFQGSPHIDSNDSTYQYALSLGSFCEGGELCVESTCPEEIYVVDTHNKIARVDGRFIHWVRGHGGGDRFSIIFFSTDPSGATPAVLPFEDFAPAD